MRTLRPLSTALVVAAAKGLLVGSRGSGIMVGRRGMTTDGAGASASAAATAQTTTATTENPSSRDGPSSFKGSTRNDKNSKSNDGGGSSREDNTSSDPTRTQTATTKKSKEATATTLLRRQLAEAQAVLAETHADVLAAQAEVANIRHQAAMAAKAAREESFVAFSVDMLDALDALAAEVAALDDLVVVPLSTVPAKATTVTTTTASEKTTPPPSTTSSAATITTTTTVFPSHPSLTAVRTGLVLCKSLAERTLTRHGIAVMAEYSTVGQRLYTYTHPTQTKPGDEAEEGDNAPTGKTATTNATPAAAAVDDRPLIIDPCHVGRVTVVEVEYTSTTTANSCLFQPNNPGSPRSVSPIIDDSFVKHTEEVDAADVCSEANVCGRNMRGCIVRVLRHGYTWNGHVIRPAHVVVAV